MNVVEDLRQLERMRESGTLTDSEFVIAKAHVLTDPLAISFRHLLDGPESISTKEIEKWRLTLAVAQMDREWEIESEPYLTNSAHGAKRAPTERSARYALIMPLVFGAILACIPTPIYLFQILSVFLAAFGAWMYCLCLANIRKYEAAFARYQMRRAAMIGDADMPTLPPLSPVPR